MNKEESDFCIKLADLVKKYPCIYDAQSPQSELFTDRAWAEISKELNIPAHLCKDKWKLMKTGFERCLNQNRYDPLYYGMDFLKSYIAGPSVQIPQTQRYSDDDDDVQFVNFDSSKNTRLYQNAAEQRAQGSNTSESKTSIEELLQDILVALSNDQSSKKGTQEILQDIFHSLSNESSRKMNLDESGTEQRAQDISTSNYKTSTKDLIQDILVALSQDQSSIKWRLDQSVTKQRAQHINTSKYDTSTQEELQDILDSLSNQSPKKTKLDQSGTEKGAYYNDINTFKIKCKTPTEKLLQDILKGLSNDQMSVERRLNHNDIGQRPQHLYNECEKSTEELIRDILESLSRPLKDMDRNQLKKFRGKIFKALGEVM